VSFIEIQPFITKQEKQQFLLRMHEPGWYQHKSTVSGRLSPLQFKQIKFRGIDAALMKMDPNTVQDWHTDGINLKRSTLILHPLTDEYAPFTVEDGHSSNPIIANTQAKHAVFNNNNYRLNLQIPFDLEYYQAIKYNSDVWKLLNSFYKENNE